MTVNLWAHIVVLAWALAMTILAGMAIRRAAILEAELGRMRRRMKAAVASASLLADRKEDAV